MLDAGASCNDKKKKLDTNAVAITRWKGRHLAKARSACAPVVQGDRTKRDATQNMCFIRLYTRPGKCFGPKNPCWQSTHKTSIHIR
jgi:hypothetical protein